MNEIMHPPALRRSPGEKRSFIKTALMVTSGLSGLMLGLAVPNLVSGDPLMVAMKSGLLAVSGLSLSYIVNRLAVERGAPLATAGYWGAAAVSVASILVVSGGLFSATYAGLTFNDVEQLRIEEHGERLSGFVAEATKGATQASRILPAISVIVGDLEQKYACELDDSCLSGFSGGGNGPVARAVLEKLGQAQALARQVQTGAAERDATLASISALYAQYQTLAVSADLTADEKRQKLQSVDLEIKQATERLKEAMPVPLLLAYASELKAGLDIADRPAASEKVSLILRQHGQTLSDVVEGTPEHDGEVPAFPEATGVSDTFNYIGHFLPIAAIAAVVELVFPISLWLYTFFARSWAIEQVSPRPPTRRDPDDDDFRRQVPDPTTHLQLSDAVDGSERTRKPNEGDRGTFRVNARAPRN